MAKRRQYTDEERAAACALLEANGYPDTIGSLEKTALATGIPARTISRWFNGEQNPPPDRIVNEKRLELKVAIDAELTAIFEAMQSKRDEASYRDLTTAAGIFVDKKIILDGGVTGRNEEVDWRTHAIRMIKDKEVDYEEMVKQFGRHDADLLFEQSGVPIQARKS